MEDEKKTFLVGFSGGADSTAALLLLHERMEQGNRLVAEGQRDGVIGIGRSRRRDGLQTADADAPLCHFLMQGGKGGVVLRVLREGAHDQMPIRFVQRKGA